jgi:anti-anti-sigma regulatory factor
VDCVLRLEDRAQDDAIVVVPSGRLDIGTYRELRDHLLKISADSPRAVIVDLTELGVASDTLLSVFSAVHTRLQQWPGIPLLLVAASSYARALVSRYHARRFMPVHDNILHAIAAIDDPPPRRVAWLQLPNGLTSPRIAREFARDTSVGWGLGLLVDDAMLLVGELVTNTVVHTPDAPLIRLELRRNLFSVAVYDDVPGQVTLLDPGAGAGLHGLLLVTQIATVWGCSPTSTGGKVVWATLRTG